MWVCVCEQPAPFNVRWRVQFYAHVPEFAHRGFLLGRRCVGRRLQYVWRTPFYTCCMTRCARCLTWMYGKCTVTGCYNYAFILLYSFKPVVHQLSKKSRSHFKILSCRCKFHSEKPKILCATKQNLVSLALCTHIFKPTTFMVVTHRTGYTSYIEDGLNYLTL